MKITGIDPKKCTVCGVCVRECPAGLYTLDGDKKVIYGDPHAWCTGCGHCVAACPKDAITYDANEKSPEYKNMNGLSSADTIKLLHTKRTARVYKNRDIPKQEIENLLNVMRYAPSGHNAQPCEYIIIKDREIKRMLAEATIKSFKAFRFLMKINKLLKPFVPKSLYELLSDQSTALGIDEMIIEYDSGKDIFFFDAPVVILVHVPNLGGLSYVDPTIAFTYGMLAAHTMGIGSCWMGFIMMAVAKHKKIMQQLNIPKGRLIAGVMTLGYTNQKYYRVPARNKIKAKWFV
jgi:nitroreductase/NAD-dependent dihydropyrimidine dehydrogenase PreA subunit